MQYHACISTKGVSANTKGGLIHGMSYGNTAITPRTLIAFFHQVKAQYDAGSGSLTGRRQHSPITIVREVDSSSPLLWQGLCTNEVLKSVDISLVGRPSSGGGEVLVSRITLTNAEISKVNRYTPVLKPHPHGPSRNSVHVTYLLEEIRFAFQKITFANVAGSTSTSDDWTSNTG
ncbi:MAG: type VI secretion system tube protein TssD [Terracidiphilus sp.]|jgi:type VI secretion system secreted protein Hcp